MFNFLSIKSLKEFSSLQRYQCAEGFPVSLCNLYVLSTYIMTYITLVLYSKRKSSITAPAANKTYLQASETQRYKEHFCLFFFPCREL